MSCLLCKGSQPTSLSSLLLSLNNFLNNPLPCPVPFCHQVSHQHNTLHILSSDLGYLFPQVLQGAMQLSEHLSTHPEASGEHLGGQVQATTVRNTKDQSLASTHHMGSDMQEEPKGENIEQVLRDLEELVDRDFSAKHQHEDEKGTKQGSSSLPEVDQMAEWPSSNSIVSFPSIQLPNISDSPSSSSPAWLTQTTPAPSLGPLSPPRPSLRSAPYKRGPGVPMGTRGNTEVAYGQFICLLIFYWTQVSLVRSMGPDLS